MTKKTKKKVAKKTTKKVAKKTVKKKSGKVIKKTIKKSGTITVHLKIGDMAPDFSLLDQNGKTVTLSEFKGKKVVVYFYPRALTPGCTIQACSLRDVKKELEANNIVVLGISADPVKKLKNFEEKKELNFCLLSDEDHRVTEKYGSWGLKSFMGREFMGIFRQSFLINEEGRIVHIMDKVNTSTHHQDVLNFFKNR